MGRVYPVLVGKRDMGWARAALVAGFRACKQGLIETFQRLIFNGIAIMAPRFGVQAPVPGFPVHSHAVKAAPGALEGLKRYLIVIALGRQLQGEADLQLWSVAGWAFEGHRCLAARS